MATKNWDWDEIEPPTNEDVVRMGLGQADLPGLKRLQAYLAGGGKCVYAGAFQVNGVG